MAVLRTLEVTNPSAAALVLSAYLRGFWGVFVLMTGLSGLGLLLSACVKHRPLDKRLDSQYTLDRGSRSSRFLDVGQGDKRANRTMGGEQGETPPQSHSALLGNEAIAEARESRLTFSDQTPRSC